MLFHSLEISYGTAMGHGIFNLTAGAAAYVTADINDEYLIRHVYLTLMHVIQHLLGAFRPYLIVTGMTEQSNAYDYVPLKGKTFLRLQELLLEARAAAQGYDLVIPYHTDMQIFDNPNLTKTILIYYIC